MRWNIGIAVIVGIKKEYLIDVNTVVVKDLEESAIVGDVPSKFIAKNMNHKLY